MLGILKSQRGSTIVLVTLVFVVLISMLALVADVGMGYAYKSKIQKAVEAAALAGAQELPVDEEAAREKAQEYLQLNYPECTDYTVTFMDSDTTIEVKGQAPFQYAFARIMGFTEGKVDAQAKAVVGTITSLDGVKPLGIENKPFVYNQIYVLKEGAGDGSSGNYGAMALGGTGSRTFEDNLKYGYINQLKVGQWVPTETGNMEGATRTGVEYMLSQCKHNPVCTYQNFERDCPRLMKLPIIDSLDVSGRSEVQIIGFAAFFLEGVRDNNGKTEIIGRFIETLDEGTLDIGQTYYGIRAVKLAP